MTSLQIAETATKKHSPMVQIAGAALANLPGERTIFLCDSEDVVEARRRNDLLIVLEHGEVPAIERIGANRIILRYNEMTLDSAVSALLAICAEPHTPICADPASQALMILAERIAKSDIPVLIEGPTGTGKEVLSRFIHGASPRADKPFIAVNCAAMPEAMLEALLFGHRKGAFTGASEAREGFFRAADGGTLLLDEIAEMPLDLQAKLLRALQEGEVVPLGATTPVKVDVRVIACANRDLPFEVAQGRFRADLYYRINVFPLGLSALRERPEDIAPLAFAMAQRHAAAKAPWICDTALAKLRAHAWPGNVRELENVIRRAMLLAGDTDMIDAADIVFDSPARCLPPASAEMTSAPINPTDPASDDMPARLASIVRHSEGKAIIETLEACQGHRGNTARQLGISERTLRYRLASLREAGVAVGASR